MDKVKDIALGEIRRGCDIGRKGGGGTSRYIRHACEHCGKERWVILAQGRPKTALCHTCAGKAHGLQIKRENHPKWIGGRVISPQGYARLLMHKHPYCDVNGYVLEHHFVMEEMLGRYLDPGEVVHHEDDNPLNNDPSNLRLFPSQAAHRRFHSRKRGFRVN